MEGPFVCPICDRGCKTRNHLREHLQGNHHKSDIVDRYLATLDG
jgi:hypothetical protein